MYNMKSTIGNKRRQNSTINIVPYIDVMLVLLIVFMVTTPLLTEGIRVNLPKAKAEAIKTKTRDAQLVVSITHDKRYFFSLNQKKQIELNQHELTTQGKILLNKHPQLKIYIKADKSINYGTVIKAMADLQRAGFSAIGLITSPEKTRS